MFFSKDIPILLGDEFWNVHIPAYSIFSSMTIVSVQARSASFWVKAVLWRWFVQSKKTEVFYQREPRGWKGCHSKKPSVDEVHTPSHSSLDTSPALSDTEQERKPHECCPHGSIPNTKIKHSDTGVTPSAEVGLEVALKPTATKSWISYHTIRKGDHQLCRGLTQKKSHHPILGVLRLSIEIRQKNLWSWHGFQWHNCY